MPERSTEPLDSAETAACGSGPPDRSNGSGQGEHESPHSAGGEGKRLRSKAVLPLRPTPPPRSETSDGALASVPHNPEPDIGRAAWPRSRLFARYPSSWLVSCLFHSALLLILGLITQTVRPASPGGDLVASFQQPTPINEVIDEVEWEVHLPATRRSPSDSVLADARLLPQLDVPLDEPPQSDGPAGMPFGLDPPPRMESLRAADAPTGGGLEGRTPEARARLARDHGGTPESEEAVERGLRWLVAYQREDGSWNFDHNKGRRSGFCPNPGTAPSTTGATALALAAFLGAGYTHQEGQYRETVGRGLYYLTSRALVTPQGVDLQEGTMYAQGLSAIALCEAYAMTGDRQLREITQGAIEFIEYAQDKQGGGWRYSPGQPGDTTVTGWQLMALRSAEMAGLRVRSPDLALVCRFLDSVASEDGARYGYMTPEPRNTTTAIGLLARMYTGWRRSEPALAVGVRYLSQWGPSKDDMYYNYYATQVLHHWGGSEWYKWNPKIRDYLIATQSTDGHAAGSWYFSGGRGDVGGRLYNTAMAIMTLEVYYRYMPLYQARAFGE